jgi:hypothetical protein
MTSPRRRGNIIVLVAAGALLFLSLMALVIDVGGWYGDRAQMQTVADVIAQVVLRRHPDAPGGSSARGLGREILKANGLKVDRFELRALPQGTGVEVTLSWRRPRRFSRRKGRVKSVDVVVQTRAQRDGRGYISLAP